MCGTEKKTETVKAHVSEALNVELMRLAAADDRSLSEYIERVLRLHVFGYCVRAKEKSEGPDRS